MSGEDQVIERTTKRKPALATPGEVIADRPAPFPFVPWPFFIRCPDDLSRTKLEEDVDNEKATD